MQIGANNAGFKKCRAEKTLLLLAVSSLFFAANISFAEAPSQQPVVVDPFQDALSKLTDKDPQVRRNGATKLAQLRNPAAADPLMKLFSDPVAYVRSAGIDALGLMRIQAASKEIARILESDTEPSVRQVAAIALGYIADHSVIPSLLKGMKDSYEGTRFACINTLGIFRDAQASGALMSELKNHDPRMRMSCVFALGNIEDKQAVPQLAELLKVSCTTVPAKGEEYLMDASVGQSVIRSMGLIGERSVVPLLKTYLQNMDVKTQIYAAQALQKMSDVSGLAVARKALNNPDASVRKISVEILAEIGTAADLDNIIKMKSDPDVQIQRLVESIIGRNAKRAQIAAEAKPASPQTQKPKVAPEKSSGKPAPAKKRGQ